MLVRAVAGGVTFLLVVALGGAAPVSAGGWAIGSLDSTPDASAGETIDVGFTILQHGVTPAELADGVGITVTGADGVDHSFAAVADGTPGHYIATVTFPDDPGTYEWSLEMGWFGTQELGTLTVESSPGDSSPATPWATIGRVTLALTVALATIAVVEVVRSRRHTPVVAS